MCGRSADSPPKDSAALASPSVAPACIVKWLTVHSGRSSAWARTGCRPLGCLPAALHIQQFGRAKVDGAVFCYFLFFPNLFKGAVLTWNLQSSARTRATVTVEVIGQGSPSQSCPICCLRRPPQLASWRGRPRFRRRVRGQSRRVPVLAVNPSSCFPGF